MNTENVVSVLCVIVKDDKILILKRSDKVSGFRGFYGPVTGILENNEDPESTAYREIEEETGLGKNEIKLVKIGNSFSTKRGGKCYTVYPFLFESKSDKIKIDWESDNFKWIQPNEVSNYNCTPMLIRALSEFHLIDTEIRRVVSCVIKNGSKALLLKRSQNVKTHKGFWDFVSGHIENDEDPDSTAKREISEELGLGPSDIHLVESREPYSILSEGISWIVYPYLFSVHNDKIKLNQEHDEFIWIDPKDVIKYNCNIGVKLMLEKFSLIRGLVV